MVILRWESSLSLVILLWNVNNRLGKVLCESLRTALCANYKQPTRQTRHSTRRGPRAIKSETCWLGGVCLIYCLVFILSLACTLVGNEVCLLGFDCGTDGFLWASVATPIVQHLTLWGKIIESMYLHIRWLNCFQPSTNAICIKSLSDFFYPKGLSQPVSEDVEEDIELSSFELLTEADKELAKTLAEMLTSENVSGLSEKFYELVSLPTGNTPEFMSHLCRQNHCSFVSDCRRCSNIKRWTLRNFVRPCLKERYEPLWVRCIFLDNLFVSRQATRFVSGWNYFTNSPDQPPSRVLINSLLACGKKYPKALKESILLPLVISGIGRRYFRVSNLQRPTPCRTHNFARIWLPFKRISSFIPFVCRWPDQQREASTNFDLGSSYQALHLPGTNKPL